MKPFLSACSACVAMLLLSACVAPPLAELPATPAGALLVDQQGALTAEGQRRRDEGVHLVASDHPADAYAAWLPLAAAGHAESQYKMGLMTRQGLGTPVDPAASLQWLRRAAGARHPEALVELARMNAQGSAGVEKNPDEALRLFLQAADLGDARAAFYAGAALYEGSEVAPDIAHGIELLTQAAQAETPSVKAQSLLGRIMLEGQGHKPDYAQALYWLQLAAAAEDSEAQCHLGELNQRGLGLARNLHKALGWYLRSAEQGYAPALHNIGMLYLKGEGVRKNLTLARRHFEQAYEKGYLAAAERLAELDAMARQRTTAGVQPQIQIQSQTQPGRPRTTPPQTR